ncbi:hypothetical protein PFISCL1PPCAC_7201, partial [Pristionchus fissidentatus]
SVHSKMVIYSSPFGSVPVSSTPAHTDVLQKIDEAIQRNPNKKAFIDGSDSTKFLTYSEVKRQTFAIAQFLHNRGFHHQTACTVIPNCKEFLSFFLGVSFQGGAVSGASALFTDYELERQFKDCRCTTIFTDEDNLEKVKKAMEGIDHVKTIIVLCSTSSTAPPATISWNEVISTPIDKNRKPVKINVKEDIVALPYSSGTTGSPKGVMVTHENFGTMINMGEKWRRAMESQTGEIIDWNVENMLLFLPFYHIYGLTMLCYGVMEKSTTIIISSFDPFVFLQCIQDYKISQLHLVPPLLVFLAKHPMCDEFDLSSLKGIASGAAPAGKDICDALQNRYPHIEYVEQGYGMTELLTSHLPDVASRSKFGSCGKLAPGLQMKIVDVTAGSILPNGKVGEICIKGPTVMKGYLGREEATKECIRDGWMHTGDIGYCDVDGDLFVIDRLKELIKVKGLQVPPAELEDILLSHPSIQDAAVIGITDARSGELPKAYIVKSDPALTAEEVYNFVKEKVSPYKNLNGGIEFIDEIPKSPAGKILRRVLREKQQSKI